MHWQRFSNPTRVKHNPYQRDIDRDAYDTGFDRGLEAAEYTEVPKAKPGSGLSDLQAEEYIKTEAFESEEHSRQYSPFEFFAQELNNDPDSDSAWKAYEAGVEAGIEKGASKRLRKIRR